LFHSLSVKKVDVFLLRPLNGKRKYVPTGSPVPIAPLDETGENKALIRNFSKKNAAQVLA
jgi:hypothetical protein